MGRLFVSLEGAQKWHATTARSGSETRSAALRKRKESPKLRALHFKFVPGEIQKTVVESANHCVS